MEITHDEAQLTKYLVEAFAKGQARILFLLTDTLVVEKSKLTLFAMVQMYIIPGIMEHLERAGVHSGDSVFQFIHLSILSEDIKAQILDETKRISNALKDYWYD